MKATFFVVVCSIFALGAQCSEIEEECLPMCPMIHDPVCIKTNDDIKSFGNSCGLKYFLCKNSELKENVDYTTITCQNGVQTSMPIPEINDPCKKICTKEIRPVCIRKTDSDQVEKFDNLCLLNVHVCQNALRSIVEFHKVACPVEGEEA